MDDCLIRVLLVDDAEDDYIFTRQILTKIPAFRVQLDWVNSFQSAVDAINQKQHDIYLLDYHLGQHDGLELLQKISLPKAPTFLLTGVADRVIDLEAMRLGVAGFLRKDEMSVESLDRALRYALKQKQIEQVLQENNELLEAMVEQRTAELRQRNQELIQLQEQLKKSLEKEQHLNQLQSQLLSSIAHEFRTPLMVISGAAELIEMRLENNPQPWLDRQLLKINDGVQRITNVLENATFLALVDSQSLTFQPSLLNLTELCQSLIENWPLPSRHHRLTFHTEGDAYPVRVDGFYWKQLMKNLLSNALGFSPEGGVVSCQLMYQTQGCIFQIRDRGIGIPAAEQTHIFDRFYRASNANSIPGTPGAGLGLAVVKQIVQGILGKITVESAPQAGTEISIHLPRP